MNWGAVGTGLSVIALAFSIGVWSATREHSQSDLTQRVEQLEKKTVALETKEQVVTLQMSPEVGSEQFSQGTETYQIGEYELCFLSYTNEADGTETACQLTRNDNNWALVMHNAACKATCLNVVSN